MNELMEAFKKMCEDQKAFAQKVFENKATVLECLNDDNKPPAERMIAGQMLKLSMAHGFAVM